MLLRLQITPDEETGTLGRECNSIRLCIHFAKTSIAKRLHNMADHGTIGPRKFIRLAENMEGKTVKGRG